VLILLANSELPICSWDWQTSKPAFYEAMDPSDGYTDGFGSRVGEFANSIGAFTIPICRYSVSKAWIRMSASGSQLLCNHRARSLHRLVPLLALLAPHGETVSDWRVPERRRFQRRWQQGLTMQYPRNMEMISLRYHCEVRGVSL
jgi:hypothetical protein